MSLKLSNCEHFLLLALSFILKKKFIRKYNNNNNNNNSNNNNNNTNSFPRNSYLGTAHILRRVLGIQEIGWTSDVWPNLSERCKNNNNDNNNNNNNNNNKNCIALKHVIAYVHYVTCIILP